MPVNSNSNVDLSLVVVSSNTKSYLQQCLRSIHRFSPQGAGWEAVVVDNASCDGSTEMVQQEFPYVRLLCNRRNVGYARAVNQGLRLARGRLVMVMNSDTQVLDGSLQAIINYMNRHPSVGGMTPMLLREDGAPQTSWARFPTLRNHILSVLPLRHVLPRSWWAGDPCGIPDARESQPREIDSPAGACFVTRRATLQSVGFMDPDYFMYYEDIDWAYRMMEAGWRRTFYPGARLVHVMGVSWPAGSQVDKLKRSLESRYIYFQKRHGWWAKAVAWFAGLLSSVLSLVFWGTLRIAASWWSLPRAKLARARGVVKAHALIARG